MKIGRWICIATLAGLMLGTVPVGAEHCGSDPSGRNAHDPFGSCEERTGTPRCGAEGTTADAATLGRVIVSEHGLQFCWDERHSSFPMRGRLTIYNSDGHAGVGADGDETHNTKYGTNGFVRIDIDTATGHVCFFGPAQGTWWTEGGGTGTTPPLACTP